jgi:hypothetical protein
LCPWRKYEFMKIRALDFKTEPDTLSNMQQEDNIKTLPCLTRLKVCRRMRSWASPAEKVRPIPSGPEIFSKQRHAV